MSNLLPVVLLLSTVAIALAAADPKITHKVSIREIIIDCLCLAQPI
jgi:hypothetical protein